MSCYSLVHNGKQLTPHCVNNVALKSKFTFSLNFADTQHRQTDNTNETYTEIYTNMIDKVNMKCQVKLKNTSINVNQPIWAVFKELPLV